MSLVQALRHLRNRAVAFIARTVFRVATLRRYGRFEIPTYPDEVISIPSRDAKRTIKAHLYAPHDIQAPSPVLINAHGSAFILPAHGEDDLYCRTVSTLAGYTVIDLQYRLAPEHPFPEALDDVQDVINWVRSDSARFKQSRIALSGFSAGANLILAAAGVLFPPETFSTLIAFYPATDLSVYPKSRQRIWSVGKNFSHFVISLVDFYSCYVLDESLRKDSRVSPLFATLEAFPAKMLFITAAQDSLAPQAVQLVERLQDVPGKSITLKCWDDCHHAWDKMSRSDVHVKARDDSYQMVVDLLLS